VLEDLEGAIATIVKACDARQPLRMGCAHRPLRAGEVLARTNQISLQHGETASGSEAERQS
jgi:hypothetical protein